MKSVRTVIAKTGKHWVGDGFHVNPVFNNLAFSNDVSPFLMLDYGSPKHFPPTKKKLGVGMHPHRGFETVTIAFQGEVEHGDSYGNTGKITPGGVQWMTAGNGIFHEEFHSRKMAEEGGTFEMVQLWVNLPAKLKMVKPRYQAIEATDIPEVPLPNGVGSVRVIAGKYQGAEGPALTQFKGQPTRGAVELWDVQLVKGKTTELDFPEGYNVIILTRAGSIKVESGAGQTTVGPERVALMDKSGNKVKIHAGSEDVKLLVMSGTPLDEPIASYGPMVMNTQKEIRDAMMWAQKEQQKYYSRR